MPKNPLCMHFPFVQLGASSFCTMKKVGFKLVLIFPFLMSSCRRSCRIYTGPQVKGDEEISGEGSAWKFSLKTGKRLRLNWTKTRKNKTGQD